MVIGGFMEIHSGATPHAVWQAGEQEANARLIAAAPELLAVARRLQAWGLMATPNTMENLAGIIADANDTIAKATAEPLHD